jgi:predicted nucleotidyltransferase
MPVPQVPTLLVDADRLREAANLLLGMGASEVFIFGSATRNELRPGSDVDIAVRGLPPARFFTAVSRATDALGQQVDLVDLDDPTPTVRYILGSGELIRVL